MGGGRGRCVCVGGGGGMAAVRGGGLCVCTQACRLSR